MRLVFFGNPKFAIPSLEKLASSRHEVACVVSSPDQPAGRGLKPKAPEVKESANRLGLPVMQVDEIRDASFLETIARYAAALFVVVAFRILPPELFSIPNLGAINLHASLLPKYRGAAPINRAIMAGETVTGVSTFQIMRQVDAGGVLLQRKEPIRPEDSFDDLYGRLSLIGADLLLATVDGLEEGTLVPKQQDSSQVTKAPKLKPEDGLIDWQRAASVIHNHIRGLCSIPGAYTFRDGEKLKIFRSMPVDVHFGGLVPGKIVTADDRNGLVVATSNGCLKILELQPSGRKRMSADDCMRGYRFQPGETLG
jgi:methionyl-tRNA formyltransferase